MPPKRKNGAEDEPTSREKKKQKVAAARTIAVQTPKSVSFAEDAIAGPSNQGAMNSKISCFSAERPAYNNTLRSTAVAWCY